LTKNNEPEETLADEFRLLGKNLVDTAHAAWDSPERQRLQKEIEEGLSELGTTMTREYEQFRESSTGQKLRDDVNDISERVRSSEIDTKIRADLISALQQVNTELEKITNRWASTFTDESETETQPDDTGEED